MPVPDSSSEPFPKLHHLSLETTFCGVEHPLSTPGAPIHQYRGIKYATIPARFRPSRLCETYPPITDASKHGPICPQIRSRKSVEENLFGIPLEDIPHQNQKQNEFECLNLNITCPGDLTLHSRVPVMLWVHGGGEHGSGSEWFYDGGSIVRKSVQCGKPIILITFNFRIGLLGFATNALIRDDNKAAGEEGTGNYGLRDQRLANEWVYHYISEFGGDPNNITLFGSGTGAADIVCHLLSHANATEPIFHRSIIQSAVFEPIHPDVGSAGWHLSRLMSALQVTNIEKFRHVEVDKLLGLGHALRVVDDGVFFREGWQNYLGPLHRVEHSHPVGKSLTSPSHSSNHLLPPKNPKSKSRSRSRSSMRNIRSKSRHTLRSTPVIPEHTSDILQPLIIGDSSADSLLWSHAISLWTASGVVRRLKAICQSLGKTSCILRGYDISPYTPDEEITDRVLELVNDARVAWPTQCIADNAKKERGGHGVWRFVFDQEGPSRGVPHHMADIMYLFDNVPLPESAKIAADYMDVDSFGSETGQSDGESEPCVTVSPGDYNTDEEGGRGRTRTRRGSFSSCLAAKCESIVNAARPHSPSALSIQSATGSDSSSNHGVMVDTDEQSWLIAPVDLHSYTRVRDAMQERWIAFAYGEVPWREDKVFVFGPEGETGERSNAIFEGRRRRRVWKEALEPIGPALVQKVGVELSRGPAHGADRVRY
ncbi:Alpha/Beta hydrolase protein [Gymnopilus junonius]|uniref:Alpha/Beta hydrolase protein n=1 Tax=Gymnopilus junonius TaxID=109634 RepID=A0A9P5NK10_GYMJU|nr:Alpha/Beta hydrolase protein [Gymnopilus junonius]